MLEVAELHAVRLAQHIERHTSRRVNPVAREIAVGTAGLQVEVVSGGDFAESARQLFDVLLGEHHQLRHIEFDLLIYFDEAENTAIHMRRQPCCHVIERFQMSLNCVRFCEQHGIVAPGHALLARDSRKFLQSLDAFLNRGHPWLHVAPISGDGVIAIRVEPIGYLVQPRQNGAVVLRTEHHAINHVGRKFQTRNLVREQGIARKRIAFLKAP